MQHGLLLNQTIFVQEEARAIAHHHHIVAEGPGVNGAWVLAHEEGSLGLEAAQTRHCHTGLTALSGGKPAWQVPLQGITSAAIYEEMPTTVGLRGSQPAMVGGAFIVQHRVGRKWVVHHYQVAITKQ